MTKRNRKHKLRLVVNNKLKVQKALKKSPKNQFSVLRELRKRALPLSILAAVAGVVGYNVLNKKEEAPREPAKITSAQKPSVKPAIPEYEEWESTIELPRFVIHKEEYPLRLAPEIAEDNKKIFYNGFDQAKNNLLRDTKAIHSTKEREALILKFINEIDSKFNQVNGNTISKTFVVGEPDFFEEMAGLNRALLPHGWVHIQTGPKHGVSVSFYQIDTINRLTFDAKSESQKGVPFIYVSKSADVLMKPESISSVWAASYIEEGNYILVHNEGIEQQFDHMLANFKVRCERAGGVPQAFDLEKARSDYIKIANPHEGGHAWLASLGINADLHSSEAIRKRGAIGMGYYELPYGVYKGANNLQLHELAGNGMGLMSSGASAPINAHGIITAQLDEGDSHRKDSYRLARDVLTLEILHSSFLSQVLRKKIIMNPTQFSVDHLIEAINQMPTKELHRIGERMAKLAIYLTQKG